jgi:hypothetical protein
MKNLHAFLTFIHVLLISMHPLKCEPASDLVILVDTFINRTNLDYIKTSLSFFMDKLDIDFETKTRVGMIEFGAESQARILSHLSNRYDQNKETLKKNKIDRMLGEYTSTSDSCYNLKNVGDALSLAHKLFTENPPRTQHQSATLFTSKVVLLFLSGAGLIDESRVYDEAERLRQDQNVEIFVYGIGNSLKQKEIIKISSFPPSLHSYFLTDYRDLCDRTSEVTISSYQVPPFVRTNDRVSIQMYENEIRYFQVDTSSYVYDKNLFLVINMTHTQGISLVYIDWLINTTSVASAAEYERPGFNLLNTDDSTGQAIAANTNKGYMAFYECPPMNSLRLYLKIVGVLTLNSFDLDINRINLFPF